MVVPLTGPNARFERLLDTRLAALDAGGLRRVERADTRAAVACANTYIDDPADFGAGASRLISGTRDAHRLFEAEVAAWQGTEAALLFNSGYNANVGLISALVTREDAVFSDALNHASIIDGVRLSRGERHVYAHGDASSLNKALTACTQPGLKLVVTESIFSMDGDLVPLADIAAVCAKHGAVLCVDEAHAIGVYGAAGQGAVDALELHEAVGIRVGTCGKAIGGFGAYVAGSKALREYLFNKARSFVFTTALPASVVEANRVGLRRIQQAAGQAKLWRNIEWVAERLAAAGWWAGKPESAIFPIMVGENEATVALANAIAERGFFVQAIRPPTVPAGTSRLRLTVSSAYDEAFITQLVDAIVAAAAALHIRPPTHGA